MQLYRCNRCKREIYSPICTYESKINDISHIGRGDLCLNCYKDFMEWLDKGKSVDADVSKAQNENKKCEDELYGYRLKIPGSNVIEVHTNIESLIRSAIERNLIENGDVSIIKRCLRIYGRHRGFSPNMEEFFIEEVKEYGEI